MNNTPMTAKEYLSQAYRIDQRINAKLEQAERLRELSRRRTVAYGGERVSHSRNVHRIPTRATRARTTKRSRASPPASANSASSCRWSLIPTMKLWPGIPDTGQRNRSE